MTDFLTIGSATVDLLLRIKDVERIDLSGQIISKLVCISFASKSEIQELDLRPGGSAANSAVAITRLGGTAGLQACIGGGPFSTIILDDLKKWGVDVSGVKIVKEGQTALGLEIISGGEKSAMVYRGAGAQLGPIHFSKKLLDSAKQVFVTSLTSKKNFNLLKKVAKYCKKKDKPIIFAPSIAMLHSYRPELQKLDTKFDAVIMNAEEANYYTGNDDLVRSLQDLPGRVKVVTADMDGAWAMAGRKIYHVPAHKLQPVDTTGAGDAFSGAFSQVYYKTGDIKKALRTAVSVATIKLKSRGARYTSSKSKLASFMKEHPVHVTERGIK